jgi:hypothetical protein
MFAYFFISSRPMPNWFKHFVFEIVLMLDFVQKDINLRYHIQTKEDNIRAYGSCREEQICVEAFDREI